MDGKTGLSSSSSWDSNGTPHSAIITYDQDCNVLSGTLFYRISICLSCTGAWACAGVSGSYGDFTLDEVKIWDGYVVVLADATYLWQCKYLRILQAN